jgi:hypothetical protein
MSELRVVIERPGVPGAPGPPGPAGSAGSIDYVYTAGETISGHRAVTLNDEGKVVYVKSTLIFHTGRIIGVTLGAATVDDEVTVRGTGVIEEPSWNWDVDLSIFLSGDGFLVQDEPSNSNGDMFSQIVGFPISPTSMHVSIQNPIILI